MRRAGLTLLRRRSTYGVALSGGVAAVADAGGATATGGGAGAAAVSTTSKAASNYATPSAPGPSTTPPAMGGSGSLRGGGRWPVGSALLVAAVASVRVRVG